MANKNFRRLCEDAEPYIQKIKNGQDINDSYEKVLALLEPVIKSVMKQVNHNSNIEEDDLYQEAAIVLWKCCLKYDKNNGGNCSFYTYYYGAALNALCNFVWKFQSPITINLHEKERTKHFRDFANEFNKENGRYPTTDEYVACGFEKEASVRFQELNLNLYTPYVQYDDLVDVEDGLGDTTANSVEEQIKNCMLRDCIEKVLDEKHRIVIQERWFEGKTYQQIADKLQIDRKTVKRYETDALNKISDWYHSVN